MNTIEIIDDKKKILMKNNVLIKARYNLSLVQSNILITILYKLQRDQKGQATCIISRKELQNLITNKSQKTLKGIIKILDAFLEEYIYFKQEKENGRNAIWGKYSFISGYEYDDETDSFKIVCAERVHELLLSYMQIGYTPINLKVYLSLKSTYSQRIYDLLRLWSNTMKNITYEIDELKELLMLENKYNEYSDFKKAVLNKSVNELNKTGMFEIKFKENKIGRKVKSVTFIVDDLDERKYFQQKSSKKLIVNDSEDFDYGFEFRIPSEHMFTDGVKLLLKKDFKEFDFIGFKYLNDAFYDALAKTLDKDKVKKVGCRSYNYLKRTLEDRIHYYTQLNIKNDI